MSYLPRAIAGSLPPRKGRAAGWDEFADELDRWGEAGQVATLWWRDDDAVTATPRLDSLLRLADGLPLALAVIPAFARPELATVLAEASHVTVLQHGWRHVNHAGDARNSEFPPGRPLGLVAAELAAGRARLAALFGGRALPVLVPPWNRFAAEYLPLLPQIGVAAVSAMGSHQAKAMPRGLVAVDVHIDPIAWRGDRGFVGEAAVLGALIRHLQASRLGPTAAAPLGLMTHHLVMDAPTAAFIEQLVATTRAHPAVRWTAIGELLQ